MNTGEFAAYCGTEKRTLFYYDQIGLLKPAVVHSNGYREYTMEQAETMDSIKIMQAAGYSLAEIKEIQNGGPGQRRESLIQAKDRLEKKIDALVAMKDYIEKKERLWQEYLSYAHAEKDYCISRQDITYTRKEIPLEDHFFSFLRDGNYDTFLLCGGNRGFLIRDGGPERKTGQAITFFLEVPSYSPNLSELIRSRLDEYGFSGEDQFFMNTVPHLYLDQQGTAVIKVVVFEKKAAIDEHLLHGQG